MEFASIVREGLITPGRLLASRSFLLDTRGAEKDEDVRLALLVVFGAAGTLARYGLQGLVQQRTSAEFPSGTLVVNLLGCFLLGGIGEYGLRHLTLPPEWRVGLTVGFLGAFTTFSTFSWETVRLLEDGEWLRAGTYILASVAGGIFAIVAGMRIAERL